MADVSQMDPSPQAIAAALMGQRPSSPQGFQPWPTAPAFNPAPLRVFENQHWRAENPDTAGIDPSNPFSMAMALATASGAGGGRSRLPDWIKLKLSPHWPSWGAEYPAFATAHVNREERPNDPAAQKAFQEEYNKYFGVRLPESYQGVQLPSLAGSSQAQLIADALARAQETSAARAAPRPMPIMPLDK